jgi:hypothetical protein
MHPSVQRPEPAHTYIDSDTVLLVTGRTRDKFSISWNNPKTGPPVVLPVHPSVQRPPVQRSVRPVEPGIVQVV